MGPESAAAGVASRVSTVGGGRYALTRRIAVGGMGEVWASHDELLNRQVAVKLLRPEYGGDLEFRERFRQEARSAASINHPGVVSVYDYGEQPDGAGGLLSYLVMELVDGPSLADQLRTEGPLGVQRTLGILAQAAGALQAAHEGGIVHRDIKPANLLLGPDGQLKITDFGIARAAEAVALTRTGTVVGTARYISPEQAAGRPVTSASDLYSLGVVAYQCLLGAPPFDEGNEVSIALAHVQRPPPSLPDTLPEPVADLVTSLLAKDPQSRPASAAAVAAAAVAAAAVAAGAMPAGAVPAGATTVASTRRVRRATATSVQPVADGSATRRFSPAAASPRARRWVVSGAVGLLALVGVLAAVAAGGAAKVVEPSFLGGQLLAARASLLHDGLRVSVRTRDVARTSAGKVVAQDPRPGSRLARGSDVTLTVASGMVAVPSLQGETYQQASAALQGLGLRVDRVLQTTAVTTAGRVTGVAPDGQVPVGSTVVLTVAEAPVVVEHQVIVPEPVATTQPVQQPQANQQPAKNAPPAQQPPAAKQSPPAQPSPAAQPPKTQQPPASQPPAENAPPAGG